MLGFKIDFFINYLFQEKNYYLEKFIMSENKTKVSIPTVFKLSGVSFCKEGIKELQDSEELKMELEPENKYDSNAIKVLNSKGNMIGYVPKKFKIGDSEIILNALVVKKFKKLNMRYKLNVKSINKWDGPTGVDVEFIKNT